LAKIYFPHPGDPRDRLGTEFNTLAFLRANGITSVPSAIAINRDLHLGIYEFVHGEKLVAGEITWDDAGHLARLLCEMWAIRNKPGAERLPDASEAHFSLRRYHDHVRARLERIETALKNESAAARAGELARTYL